MTKILVGTLFSGENEYAACLEAIRKQSFQNFEHMLIENLPELEAHNKLYRAFIDHAEEYELLIKVDADTVLLSEDLFARIVEKFAQNQWLEVMNIGVLDFFTDEMIPAGIQIYRNTVRWDFSKDTVFPDIPIMDPQRYLYDKTDLAPAATHCQDPSNLQAFHYGVHRGLKSIQKVHSTSHWKNLQKVWDHFVRSKDVRLGFAILGAELVYKGTFNREDQNYTNPNMDQVFDRYKDWSEERLVFRVLLLRSLNWGFLPAKWRQRILRQIRGKHGNNWDAE